MKIKTQDRKKLQYYLNKFYSYYPEEKYSIFHFVKFFKERLKDNKDAWVGVSGGTGVGKSYFVIMASILFGRPFSLKNNIAYNPQGNEIINKFDSLSFQCLLIDESAREMRSVNWHSKTQQQVNTKAMTDRFKNNMIFLNMPNFNEFTKSMRMTNILFRAVVLYRNKNYARVVIQRRSTNWRSDDPWGDKLANKIYEKLERKKRIVNNETILSVERGLPNTLMDFIIPNLALPLPHIINEYERLKSLSRKEEIELEEKDPYKKKYFELMKKAIKIIYENTLNLGNNKVSKKEVAKALNISYASLYNHINREVKNENNKEEPNV
jgi:hypothetical protein